MRDNKQLLVLPASAKLTQAQRKDLRDNGFVVLQVDDPASVRQITPSVPPINGSNLLLDAMRVIRTRDDYASYRLIMDAIIRELVKNCSE